MAAVAGPRGTIRKGSPLPYYAQLAAILRQSTAELTEVDAALARVAAGEYGVCEECGLAIAPARLEARPTARLCIDCAARR